MTEKILAEVSKKLNVLIALSLRQLLGEKEFSGNEKRKQGVGELARYFNNMGIEAKDIAEITGAPLQSVRTLLTPKRRE
ncbi:hypothetical protein CO134_03945 [Candidatus Kuenenbacteria bacterium CG_4_9_14_3_um_filter_39_14]|uniref:Uncharacterized protein n=5 Tax=Candidatus Kueneniibacteriota TaxID=1752740 RepID=A0A2M7IM11_9BACT|nr:MAG: hypothetical protein COX28_00845 [Candidatus Kuenenbacteria bacterium CG23_combo_of_CG06-09_8_20_14_all_39_39]PIP75434.1 MAG: hypothetical protein COW86_03790 [Candidatus Kuenenbacteria bacterium CG22_combo_CG10-13_8_21_14_all_39_9]PIW95843.1 MAG: hypothetical protein COZ84_01295 [Candidatus Kuenenbacteria bacterium CG_4_8_14_3_um_filter_39_15]PIX92442.1 MAG: hypothetical protein COZ26_01805 [Candidatus Kuenenbacteria bacterium CG_4_10_14_3_um_filter_39_14]PJA91716.1 MAG: hypothetical p